MWAILMWRTWHPRWKIWDKMAKMLMQTSENERKNVFFMKLNSRSLYIYKITLHLAKPTSRRISTQKPTAGYFPPGELPPRISPTLKSPSLKFPVHKLPSHESLPYFWEGKFSGGDFLAGSSPGGNCPCEFSWKEFSGTRVVRDIVQIVSSVQITSSNYIVQITSSNYIKLHQ